jgi:hypothetical protein
MILLFLQPKGDLKETMVALVDLIRNLEAVVVELMPLEVLDLLLQVGLVVLVEMENLILLLPDILEEQHLQVEVAELQALVLLQQLLAAQVAVVKVEFTIHPRMLRLELMV